MIQKQKLSPWLLAIRPKTLPIAVVPMLLGTILARAENISINWLMMLSGLLSAVLTQAGTNVINDALDFKKGADRATRLGPVRVTQNGLLTYAQVYAFGWLTFIFAILVAVPLITEGGLPFALIISFSVLSGYLYTGGPYPLAYYGLGELFVLIFYGIVGPNSMYAIQTGFISSKSVLAGLQVGCIATAVIGIVNLRDIVDDAQSKKWTLAVLFGKSFARIMISLLLFLPFVLSFFWLKPLGIFLTAFSLPLCGYLIYQIWINEPGKIYNKFAGMTVLYELLFGALLIGGILIS